MPYSSKTLLFTNAQLHKYTETFNAVPGIYYINNFAFIKATNQILIKGFIVSGLVTNVKELISVLAFGIQAEFVDFIRVNIDIILDYYTTSPARCQGLNSSIRITARHDRNRLIRRNLYLSALSALNARLLPTLNIFLIPLLIIQLPGLEILQIVVRIVGYRGTTAVRVQGREINTELFIRQLDTPPALYASIPARVPIFEAAC